MSRASLSLIYNPHSPTTTPPQPPLMIHDYQPSSQTYSPKSPGYSPDTPPPVPETTSTLLFNIQLLSHYANTITPPPVPEQKLVWEDGTRLYLYPRQRPAPITTVPERGFVFKCGCGSQFKSHTEHPKTCKQCNKRVYYRPTQQQQQHQHHKNRPPLSGNERKREEEAHYIRTGQTAHSQMKKWNDLQSTIRGGRH